MRWNQLAATAVSIGAVSAAGIATAVAAPAGQSGLGLFTSWKAAQSAAGFALIRPSRTYGHVLNGKIVVTRCEVKKKEAKHVVIANYGLTPFSTLALYQNNSGAACSTTGKVKTLGRYPVDGTTAQLTGKCGMRGLRSCKSSKIFLFLTWRRHGIYYVASSFGERPKTLVGFATGLRPAG